MKKIHVGVLRGGTSHDHFDKSVQNGADVLRQLPEKYIGHDVLITKDGTWHFEGIPVTPEKLFKKVDVIFNAIKGDFAENGHIQRIFQLHNKAYTGADFISALVSRNKAITKKILAKQGVKVPHSIELRKEEFTKEKVTEIFRIFPMPAIVKPVFSAYSIGISLARNIHELEESLKNAFIYSPIVLIEEYIQGKDAKCIVLENFRGKKHYAFFPIEVKKPSEVDFLDSEIRTTDRIEKISPGNFSDTEKACLEKIAIQAHKIIGLRHSSKSDFIVNPKRGIYFLEIETIQDFSDYSSTVTSLSAVGATLPQFIEHVIELARKEKK